MSNTDTSVGLLKAIALIAGLAILLWSLGLPSLSLVQAASVSSYSDTLSDSAPSATAIHTISFTTPTGVANGETITFTFPSGFTGIGSIVDADVTIEDDTVDISGNVSAAGASQTVTLTLDTGTIAAASVIDIVIGGTNLISNPASEGSYEIDLGGTMTDTGATRVVIIDNVQVTASVDTVFTFAISGVGAGTTVNGDTTTGTTSTTSIPFGTLSQAGGATTSAQQLTVNTNASNGYVVTVQTDGALQSTTGGVIDNFANGSDTDTPVTWASQPLGADINDATTWGHWGFTTDDATTTRDAGDEFDADEYAAASTTPRVVMSHDGPVNGTGTGVGTTLVGYKVEITNLQEAGDDYSTTLTYIATPTF